MNRRVFTVVLAMLLSGLLVSLGNGSPLTGKRAIGKRIDADSNFILREKFRGGERACLIVKGDHKPIVNLGVYIYDAKDRLVAEDHAGGDYVAVIWYPPRDSVYKIKVHNPGKEYNECYISFK
jgi:hypothetical protein